LYLKIQNELSVNAEDLIWKAHKLHLSSNNLESHFH
jgi:hypothetical protein